jgi:hypothetical protein
MDIYQAKHGFATEDPAGVRVHVAHGDTVREGHWLLAQVPDAFAPLAVTFDVEPAPSGKGKTPAAAGAAS